MRRQEHREIVVPHRHLLVPELHAEKIPREKPLALELNDRLEEINLSAVACRDGKVVGNDRDVRVFNIRHIKGLEFEAVFFVDLDQTVSKHPDLFSKYLYVGATRAATYLGVTFKDQVPEQIEPLSHHFGEDWSI
jgi:superfamily I DNA/RNA helicase